MRSARPALLLTALLPPAVTGAATWWALATNRWAEWGVLAMAPQGGLRTSFADLANITATAVCVANDWDPTACDPYGRAFQPYVLLPARVLAALGIGQDSTGTLGALLALIYVLTVAALAVTLARLWRGPVGTLVLSQLLLAVLAISSSAMLAIERGQIELLTLALTVAALLMLSRAGSVPRALGGVAAVLAVATKFFAIGMFAPFLRRGQRNTSALVALGVSVVLLAISWPLLQQASTAAMAQEAFTSKSQFGSSTLIATVLTDSPVDYVPSQSVVDSWTAVRIAGWIVTALAILVVTLLLRRGVVDSLDRRPTVRVLILGSTGAVFVPYILGVSHDYRQLFLLPALVGALAWASQRPRTVVPWLLITGITVTLVTGAAMIGDGSGFLWPKQAMVLGDLALLGTLAVGAGLWIRGLGGRRA